MNASPAQFLLLSRQRDRLQAKWPAVQAFSARRRHRFQSTRRALQKSWAPAATEKAASTFHRSALLLRQAADSRWQNTATAQSLQSQERQISTKHSESKSTRRLQRPLTLSRRQTSDSSWRQSITAQCGSPVRYARHSASKQS